MDWTSTQSCGSKLPVCSKVIPNSSAVSNLPPKLSPGSSYRMARRNVLIYMTESTAIISTSMAHCVSSVRACTCVSASPRGHASLFLSLSLTHSLTLSHTHTLSVSLPLPCVCVCVCSRVGGVADKLLESLEGTDKKCQVRRLCICVCARREIFVSGLVQLNRCS